MVAEAIRRRACPGSGGEAPVAGFAWAPDNSGLIQFVEGTGSSGPLVTICGSFPARKALRLPN